MSEHSPGPWRWEKVDQPGCVMEWTLKGPDVLCRFWYDVDPSADARLIEAAPGLEHELGGIADALAAGDTVTIEPGSVKAERIHATIAKANPQPPR